MPARKLPQQTSFRQLLGIGTSTLRHSGSLPPELVGRLARIHGAELPCRALVQLMCGECGLRRDLQIRCDGNCAMCPRRADKRAAALADVLPREPVRHWVLTLPPRLREACAIDEELSALIGRAFVREIFRANEAAVRSAHFEELVAYDLHCGGASLVHRAGASLNLNVHVHALALDGAYAVPAGDEAKEDAGADARFIPLDEGPTEQEIDALARRVFERIDAERRRRERPRVSPRALESVRAAAKPAGAGGGSSKSGPAGLVGAAGAAPPKAAREEERATSGRTAEHAGVRVHATEAVDGNQRREVLKLARYLTRPLVDLDAVEATREGKVRFRIEPRFDPTRPDSEQAAEAEHVEMPPRELASRLVALLPDAAAHRVSYHGVLAPRSAQRWKVVPTQLVLIDERDPRRPNAVRRTAAVQTPPKGSERGGDLPPPVELDRALFICERCDVEMDVVAVHEAVDAALEQT